MSIGRSLFWLLPIIFLMSCSQSQQPTSEAATKPEDAQAAWWLTIDFPPTTTSVNGIDVRNLNETWRYAKALEISDLQAHLTEAQVNEFKNLSFSFSLSADLDHDNIMEDFFVGTFVGKDGTKGKFLAIARNGKPVSVLTDNGSTGFSALMKVGTDIRWYKCMQCGEFETVRWTGTSYVLE